MKELIVIETSRSQRIKKLLEQENINYRVYQEPLSPKDKKSLFANYDEAFKDHTREQEAQELENAEEEDIVNEEW